MIEFVIQGERDEDFGLHTSTWREALRPMNLPCEYPTGFGVEHLCILVEGNRICFSPEPPGWQVTFEGDVPEEWAYRVAQAICANMARMSGQLGTVIPV